VASTGRALTIKVIVDGLAIVFRAVFDGDEADESIPGEVLHCVSMWGWDN
jgi:hypothetical protein